jgi:signal transduction histidine kinase/CheY-like chemotaxis protein
LFILLIFPRFFQHILISPLENLLIGVKKANRNDLSANVPVRYNDEIGFLTQSFNQMVRSLAKAEEERLRRLQLEKEKEIAEAANRAKSTFLANMSHELRTPLNGILGYAQLLRYDPTLSPKQINEIITIEQSGKHLLALINDILDLAKIEAGKTKLNLAPVSIPTLLSEVQQIVHPRITAKNLKFELESHNLPPLVHADEQRLRQVLLNLLGNAIKFTEQGHITLTVRHPTPPASLKQASLYFEVSDTGIGIAPNDLERIFEAFEQTGPLKQQQQGTGLGLAISRDLVAMMGGQLQARSTLGKGSAFFFEIPIKLQPATPEASSPQIEQGQILGLKGPSKHIVVVDDVEPNLTLLVNALETLGFTVASFNQATEALQALKNKPADLIITDIVMPEMDGLTFAKAVQRHVKATIPIIASSASVYDEMQERAIQAGCTAFLPKPIDLNQLLTLLETHLHIEWERRSPAPRTILADLPLPPAETLQMLCQAAQTGDITTLQNFAEALAATETNNHQFLHELNLFINQFDFVGLESWLTKFITTPLPKA